MKNLFLASAALGALIAAPAMAADMPIVAPPVYKAPSAGPAAMAASMRVTSGRSIGTITRHQARIRPSSRRRRSRRDRPRAGPMDRPTPAVFSLAATISGAQRCGESRATSTGLVSMNRFSSPFRQMIRGRIARKPSRESCHGSQPSADALESCHWMAGCSTQREGSLSPRSGPTFPFLPRT
jgi:hypothetical protein